jgi:type IV fimbrial biogenesis protein FimT
MSRRDSSHGGFTLIEVIVAMLVAAILVALAVPALAGAIAAGRTAEAKSALTETMLLALNHSTATRTEVVVCPAGTAGCSGSVDWTGGWVAFADLNGNRLRDEDDTLLRRQPALGRGVHLRTSSGRPRIVFQPSGGATAGSNATFTFCDGRGPEKATTLVLANSGRFRQATATREQAHARLQPP